MYPDMNRHDILYTYPPNVMQKLTIDGREVYTLFGNVLPPTQVCDVGGVNCRTFKTKWMTEDVIKKLKNPNGSLVVTPITGQRCYQYKFMA